MPQQEPGSKEHHNHKREESLREKITSFRGEGAGEARRTQMSLWVSAPGRCQEMLGKAWTHNVDREVPKSVLTWAGRAKRA